MTKPQVSDRVVRMLQTALDLEREGEAFFVQAAQNCYNPTGRLIFEMLAEDERGHIHDIEDLFRSLRKDGQWSEEILAKLAAESQRDARTLLAEVARQHTRALEANPGDREALEIGLDFERRALRFYQVNLEDAEDPEERRFIELLIAEERHHVALLSELQALLADPATWLRAMEPS